MGWLHWTPEVVLKTDVNLIRIAIDGHVEMLGMIFGTTEKSAPKGRMTPDSWRDMVQRHNTRYDRVDRREQGDG